LLHISGKRENIKLRVIAKLYQSGLMSLYFIFVINGLSHYTYLSKRRVKMSRYKVMTILGTRPEVIKLVPVIREVKRQGEMFDHTLVTTAQHKEMLYQVLKDFDMAPDIDFGLMQQNQTLAAFASRSLAALSELLSTQKPDVILVQGDTTTVMTAALAAFYQGVKVGHVEAGLRSFDRNNPFPEEINRRIAGCLADMHFAPTEGARTNLLKEGVSPQQVFVTGNTIVDALQSMPLNKDFDDENLRHLNFNNNRLLLVTAHRRENHGQPLRSICQALKSLTARFADIEIVYPVHLNPNISTVVREELGGTDRIHLVAPTSYKDLLRLMNLSYLILTDSGGIQEEAPSFHKPVLILREVTERAEVVESGAGKLVGTEVNRIVSAAEQLLTDAQEYTRMSTTENPFGDGHAAERIVKILSEQLS
jgi:UDP-N-acetylglucosamine 2-epimerase (non-hydrolysing)